MSDTQVNPNVNHVQGSMSENIPKMTKYMKLIGLLQIIGGALYCITIIGAIIGVPVIFMGIRLREAADGFRRYLASDSKQDLEFAVEKQTRSFFIQFVLAIIGLVIMGIYIIVLIGLLASGKFPF
jgi:hypothetical protein